MDEAFFRPVDPAAGSWAATPACAGPWSAGLMHGGPPSALLVADAESVAGIDRTDLAAHRVALDFLGPIPVGPVDVSSRVVRRGRSVVLVDGELSADGRPCLRARTWLVRGDVPEPTPEVTGDDAPLPGPDDITARGDWDFPYALHLDWRPVTGGGRAGRGPAQIWARSTIPLVSPDSGHRLGPMSGLQRAVLVGDSGSGVSAELDWDEWAFLNIDLDVHLLRQPEGEWLLLDSRTRLGPAGTGLAATTFHDVRGVVGAGAQTLVVSRRV